MAESIQFVKGRRESDRLRLEMNNAGAEFNANLLSPFYFDCFTGNITGVKAKLPILKEELDKPETHMKFTSLLCVSSGSQRTAPNPRSDHVATAKFLIEQGANPNAQDVYGYTTVMHITSRSSRLDVARVLLEGGALPNIRNRFGCVALHESVMAGNTEACKLLCDFGADPSIKDVDGITPYACAMALPEINMILSNASKKLGGEQVPAARDFKKCAHCQKPGQKMCSICQSVYYCDKECQKSHWKVHKITCKKPSEQADYVSVDTKNIPAGMSHLATISTQSIYEQIFDDGEIKSTQTEPGKISDKRKPDHKFVVKVQVPRSSGQDPMMVYNKNKKFQTLIVPSNCLQYQQLSSEVKSKGIMGAKAYFNAIILENGELRIFIKDMLPQQPW